jgi:hypothetical protein
MGPLGVPAFSGDELLPEGTSTAMLGQMDAGEKIKKAIKYSAIGGGVLLVLAGYFYWKQRRGS